MELNMTEGDITRKILIFSLPIVMGNIVQQLYNTADAMIVSKMISNNAFAAVSVANPIMLVVLFFLVGMALGMNPLLAREYGSGNEKSFRTYYSTALIAGVGFTIAVSIFCIAISGKLLQMANTPAEIFDDTHRYLTIVFGGLIFSFLYNYFANVLRAMGDSRAAFLFLLMSSILNVFLDILFIKYTTLGVAGAAIATVISQAASCSVSIVYAIRRYQLVRMKLREFVFDTSILTQIIAYSYGAALQQTVLYLGRLIVQGTINAQGIDMITGYNAAFRLESFVVTFMEGVINGLSTFVGQNLGARKMDRMKKGFRSSVIMTFVYIAAAVILIYAFTEPLVGLYVSSEHTESIALGCRYLRAVAPGYFLCNFTANTQGYFRGIGKNALTMRATTLQMLVRCPLTIILVPRIGIIGIAIACTSGWTVMIMHNLFFLRKYYSEETVFRARKQGSV